jgi:hypothetical protein
MTFEEWWNTKDYPDCCLLRCKRAFNEGRAELEKENAELKKKIGIYQKGMYEEIEKRDKKLTKATEIIKDCIHILKHSGTALDWKTVINQAEQFLKEIEK